MAKFSWHNTKKMKDAEFVITGIPDEKKSKSDRRGINDAPAFIRDVSKKYEVFESHKDKKLSEMFKHDKKIFDNGNKKRKKLSGIIEEISKQNKIPVTIGGDHHITCEILKGLDKLEKKISVVYFDAHPDFIGKEHPFVCNPKKYEYIDFSSSIELGVRFPLKRSKEIKTLTPVDIGEMGIKRTINEIRRTIGRDVYISIDMDVVDPAFAPGVSDPLPGGISSVQLIGLLQQVAKLGILGFDIVGVNPQYDFQNVTSHLASRAIIETILNTENGHKKKY
ncbi:arginase family protein [Candidatus Aenigmatarchaeota archaeon]